MTASFNKFSLEVYVKKLYLRSSKKLLYFPTVALTNYNTGCCFNNINVLSHSSGTQKSSRKESYWLK